MTRPLIGITSLLLTGCSVSLASHSLIKDRAATDFSCEREQILVTEVQTEVNKEGLYEASGCGKSASYEYTRASGAQRRSDVVGDAPAEVAPPAETKPHALSGCQKSTTDSGLMLDCGSFHTVLARLTHDSAITEEILAKVEHDLIGGFAAGAGGELQQRELSASTPEGAVEISGFDVSAEGTLKASGAVLAIPSGEQEVLTVLCFAKADNGADTCAAVMSDVLTKGLPDLD